MNDMHSPVIILTRQESFSASHRLYAKNLSEEVNQELFGPCCNRNGHGHNYIIEVSVRGGIDATTGMLMNLKELKTIMDEEVLQRLDHRYLNLDVEEFTEINPTVENMAVVIWGWLQVRLKEKLYEIKLYETNHNWAIYRGETSPR